MSDKMTMDEALKRISFLKGELDKNGKKLQPAVTWATNSSGDVIGTKSEWNFADLLVTQKVLTSELVKLSAKLAKANASRHVKVPVICRDLVGSDDILLVEAIRWLAEWKSQIKKIEELYFRSDKQEVKQYEELSKRYEVSEIIQHCSAVTEIEREKMVLTLKEQFNALNNAVDRVNNSQYV